MDKKTKRNIEKDKKKNYSEKNVGTRSLKALPCPVAGARVIAVGGIVEAPQTRVLRVRLFRNPVHLTKSLDLRNVMLEAVCGSAESYRIQAEPIISSRRDEGIHPLILPCRKTLLLSRSCITARTVQCPRKPLRDGRRGRFSAARRRFNSSKKCRAMSKGNSRRNDFELHFEVRIPSDRSTHSPRGSGIIPGNDDEDVQEESFVSGENCEMVVEQFMPLCEQQILE